MWFTKKGAARFILNESPHAVATHCCSYNLNLSLASSQKEPITENVLETYIRIVIFFSNSPKRECLLEYIYSVRCKTTERRKILVGLCGTRWFECDVSYKCSYSAIPFIAESFETINGTHPELEQFSKTRTTGCDAQAKIEAASFLNALTKFELIVGIISLYRSLHPVTGTSDKLQGHNVDIIEAHESVSCCIDDIKYTRENVKKEFDQVSMKPNEWR